MGEEQQPHPKPPLAGIRYGRIIWATVTDPRGVPKDRPCIVVTPTDQIEESEPFFVVAITTTFPEPPPPGHVPLPWNNDPRRVGTRLSSRCAAVTHWVEMVRPEEVRRVAGEVPKALMEEIRRQATPDTEAEGEEGKKS